MKPTGTGTVTSPAPRGIVLVIPVVAVSLLVAGCGNATKGHTPTRIQPTKSFPRDHLRPITGSPAIGPISTSGVTPDQVLSYASAHPLRHSLSRKNPAVIEVVQLTTAELSQQLNGENFGVPNDEKLFVAELAGHFVFSGPPGIEKTYRLGIEVFDAKTGNILASGGLIERLKTAR